MYSFAVQAIAVVILCTSYSLIPVPVLSFVAGAVAVVLASMFICHINMATKTTNSLQLIHDDPRSSILRKERVLCLLACVEALAAAAIGVYYGVRSSAKQHAPDPTKLVISASFGSRCSFGSSAARHRSAQYFSGRPCDRERERSEHVTHHRISVK
jgi:hypothetical protein